MLAGHFIADERKHSFLNLYAPKAFLVKHAVCLQVLRRNLILLWKDLWLRTFATVYFLILQKNKKLRSGFTILCLFYSYLTSEQAVIIS
jgi:hypothetical protein